MSWDGSPLCASYYFTNNRTSIDHCFGSVDSLRRCSSQLPKATLVNSICCCHSRCFHGTPWRFLSDKFFSLLKLPWASVPLSRFLNGPTKHVRTRCCETEFLRPMGQSMTLTGGCTHRRKLKCRQETCKCGKLCGEVQRQLWVKQSAVKHDEMRDDSEWRQHSQSIHATAVGQTCTLASSAFDKLVHLRHPSSCLNSRFA